MAILRDGDGVAAQIIMGFGVNPGMLYNSLIPDFAQEQGGTAKAGRKKDTKTGRYKESNNLVILTISYNSKIVFLVNIPDLTYIFSYSHL